MRIGIDATCCWNRRGFGRFTLELIRALLERPRGHEFSLLVDREPDWDWLPAGCEVVNARPTRTVTESAVAGGRRSLGDMWRSRKTVTRMAPDVFFFPAVYSYFPVRSSVPTVVCVHDTIAETFPQLVFPDRKSRWAWAAKMRLALRQAARVMTVSEASKSDIIRTFGTPSGRIDVVTEGPSRKFRRPDSGTPGARVLDRLGVAASRPYLLYVGGISPHKNLGTLLDAMKTVLHGHDVTLVMAGDLDADGFLANAAELKAKLASDPRLHARAVFTGFVSDDDLVALYQGAAALVFPSLLEGFGLPAVEAMACGTPVLASRVGSLPEVVGDAGLLFDPRSAGEIAAAIARLLDTEGLRADLARRAEARSGLFTWERAADLALVSLEAAVR